MVLKIVSSELSLPFFGVLNNIYFFIIEVARLAFAPSNPFHKNLSSHWALSEKRNRSQREKPF